MRKIIWLFGENEGKTLNNNSYYFWNKVCDINDEIEKYFVVKKTSKNVKFVQRLPKSKRKKIVWKNSIRHWRLFFKSNTHIVSLTYKDVTPSIFKKSMNITKPVIYLQHGTLGIKRIGYEGNGYHNKFLRFFIYNEEMMDIFAKKNNFKDYQLYYAKYHPRYMELVRRNNLEKKNRQFLYFMTWREYFGNNEPTKKFIDNINKLVSNKKLNDYLKENKIKFKICVHQYFDEKKLSEVYKNMDRNLFDIVNPSQIDVMDELAYSELLITDYSSVGFDFTFLNKPVLLFAPDFDEYLKERQLYCNKKEYKSNVYLNNEDLIEKIISGNYEINKFFRKRLPKTIDYQYILEGKHIDRIYDYLRNLELNKIVFLGYKFGGRGGSVSATKALAEGLLEKGYYVELASLKGELYNASTYPYGLRDARISFISRFIAYRLYEKICMSLNFLHTNKGSLEYDNAKSYLPFNIKRRINKYLKNCTARTIVSTRETLHEYICNLKNDNIKNKVYFFHTDYDALNKLFVNLSPRLEKYNYDKIVFVSESNKEKYNKKLKFKDNGQYVIGNSLTSDKIIERNKIEACGKKEKYKGICLLRLSNERKEDINRIISFGKYLKNKKCKKFTIDIYGIGEATNYLKNEIRRNKLNGVIAYKGLTDTPFEQIQKHDFIVDFSVYQSFGMIYIEGILAGKKIYAANNDGSNDVLKNIKENIYIDEDDLFKKLSNIDKVKTKELVKYYDIVLKEYGKEKVADSFIDILK